MDQHVDLLAEEWGQENHAVLNSSGLINVAQRGVKVILLLAYEANVIVNGGDFGGSLTQSLSSSIESGCEQILAANWRR